MSRFDFVATPLAGLRVVQRKILGDQRGFLSRFYCADEFAVELNAKPISQINHTFTGKCGTVRGMHFQYPPHAEAKLVSCVRGEIFDVAVDLRRGSPTFLAWHGEILSAHNRKSLYIPEGFAHGLQTLTDDCELIYLHTAAYEPTAEGAISATDPCLAISWPLPITEMSNRDRAHPLLSSNFHGITL